MINEILEYLHIIISLLIACVGSGFIGYLDHEFLNGSISDRKQFIKEHKYKYALGYIFVFTGIVLIIIYSIKLFY